MHEAKNKSYLSLSFYNFFSLCKRKCLIGYVQKQTHKHPTTLVIKILAFFCHLVSKQSLWPNSQINCYVCKTIFIGELRVLITVIIKLS